MALRSILNCVQRRQTRFTPFDFYSLCQTVESTQWLSEEPHLWDALGEHAAAVRIRSLPQAQLGTLMATLQRHNVVADGLRDLVPSTASKVTSSPVSLSVKEISDFVQHSLRHKPRRSAGGRVVEKGPSLDFFKRCADLSPELDPDDLVNVLRLMESYQCKNDDIIRRISQRLQLRLQDIATPHLAALLLAYCGLGFTSSRIVASVTSLLAKRVDEMTYNDAETTLKGLSLADKGVFNEALFHQCVSKLMETLNTTQSVTYPTLKLITTSAASRNIGIPEDILYTLVRCACDAVTTERSHWNVAQVFTAFVRLGVHSPTALQPIADRLTKDARLYDIVQVNACLLSCGELDGPLESTIIALVDRASAVISSAHVGQLCDILGFCCELSGAEAHPIVSKAAVEIIPKLDMMSPAQAAHLLVCLLRLQSRNFDALVGLSRIVASRMPKEFVHASAILRVMMDTGLREPVFVKYFHAAVGTLVATLNMDDLLLAYRGLRALQVEDPRLDVRIAKRVKFVCRDPKVAAELPAEFQPVMAAAAAEVKA